MGAFEQRNSPRLNIQLPAHFREMDSAGEGAAIVANLNAEGLCFVTKKKLELGTEVELRIQLTKRERVTLQMRVIWLKTLKSQYRVGVRVIDANRADEERFLKFYCKKVLIAPKNRNKILIIDDERDMAQLLRMELEQQNYDVLCAYDGEEGYERFVKDKPDLVILDLMLPKLNGYALCRKIRREFNDQETPILVLSAKREDEDRIIARVIGAESFLTKPFKVEDLLKEIGELLNQN